MEVFVYGTLTDPDRVERVVDEFEFRGSAVLDGLHRVEGEYPTLAPGGSTTGRILDTPRIDTLDAYEGVERGLYVRIEVPVAGDSHGDDRVAVYVGDPEMLGVGVEVTWPGEGSFAERVRAYCSEANVKIRIA